MESRLWEAHRTLISEEFRIGKAEAEEMIDAVHDQIPGSFVKEESIYTAGCCPGCRIKACTHHFLG